MEHQTFETPNERPQIELEFDKEGAVIVGAL
jgi:hypothetical protein